MTLAICTVCGARKFGAFVPCNECGSTPRTVAERSKSLTLSDHNYPLAELQKFSQILKSGVSIPYDPVGLAMCAEQIVAHGYYWQYLNPDVGELPCRRCGKRFRPDMEEEFCPTCKAATEQPVPFCPRCVAIYDPDTRFCPRCGSVISKNDASIRSIAFSLMLGVERLADPNVPRKGLDGVDKAFDGLSAVENGRYSEETLWLAIYTTSTILRANAHSDFSVGMRIYRNMSEIYNMSLAFRSLDPDIAAQWSEECCTRFEEYDSAVNVFLKDATHDPSNWFLALAQVAEKHCYPPAAHGIAAWQLVVEIGYFIKVQTGILKSALSRTR